ncbi:MAG: NAD(P)/FAD-dependent oxidoreductase [Polyangiales bacterium]
MNQRAQVVIVGGGFGGLTCARALASADVDVTLVDRQNHHLFQPLLYQVAMAGLSPSEIAMPIRSIVRKQKNVRVLLADVDHVDLVTRQVHIQPAAPSSGPLPYDYLVLAPGAGTHYFGHDEWGLYAPGLKSIDDAVEIRRRVLLAFEAAEREPSPEKRAQLLSFVVIGGGPTGVEVAGAIAELSRFALGRDFRQARPSEARVLLIEGGPRVLPAFDVSLSEKAVLQLAELGVHVRTGTVVESIGPQGVRLRTGELLLAETIVWAAGVACSPLIRTLGVEVDRQGRAKVEQDCSLPGHPESFVIGDAACFLDAKGNPLPGVSPTAMQMGRYVAELVRREVRARDQPDKPARTQFRYADKGSMATIGRSRAIAQVQDIHLSGALAWLAWLAVHIWYLIGFRNRFLVMFDWAWSYITYRRGARLITGGRMQSGPPLSLMPGAPRSKEARIAPEA